MYNMHGLIILIRLFDGSVRRNRALKNRKGDGYGRGNIHALHKKIPGDNMYLKGCMASSTAMHNTPTSFCKAFGTSYHNSLFAGKHSGKGNQASGILDIAFSRQW